MVTIVIPTLWRSPDTLHTTINSFKAHTGQYPGTEFILIDNANSDYVSDVINVIKPRKNIGVNPAWNIGVDLADNENVIIMNDDLTLNWKPVFECLTKFDFTDFDYGTISSDRFGLCIDGQEVNEDNDELIITRNHSGRFFGFGCFFMVRKSTYHAIPRMWPIFHGDDIIYYIQEHLHQRKSYFFQNLRMPGRFSVTSNSEEFHPMMEQEHDTWDLGVKAMDAWYQVMESPWYKGVRIDDVYCNCEECDCERCQHGVDVGHTCCHHGEVVK